MNEITDSQLKKLPLCFSHIFALKGLNKRTNPGAEYDKAKTPKGKSWTTADAVLSIKQQQQLLDTGHWLGAAVPEGFVIVDIDDSELGEILYEALSDNVMNFGAIRTPNGYQFIFKDNGSVEKQTVKAITHLGIAVDYRLSGKGYIVLPTDNTEGRMWLQSINSGTEELPSFLQNVGKLKDEYIPSLPIGEGGRNSTLFEWATMLRTKNVETGEVTAALHFLNDHFTDSPLEDDEMRVLCGQAEKLESGKDYDLKRLAEEFDFLDDEPPSESRKKGEDFSNVFFGRYGFEPASLGKVIADNMPLVSLNGQIYIYRNGVYELDTKHRVEKIVISMLGPRYKGAHSREVLNYLHIEKSITDDDLKPNTDIINVKNGLLDWRTGTLKPHTSDFLSFSQIPVLYDENATCEAIESFVSDVLPADSIQLFYEWLGYALIPSTKYQKALFLTGTGSNGKSVALELTERFIGKAQISNISLQEMERSRFKVASMKNKLLNIYSDLADTALDKTDIFKVVTSGESITAEHKGKDPFSFKNYARLMFSANSIPHSSDTSNGFLRRLIILNFPNRFGGDSGKKADVNLLDKLSTDAELSGLLTKAIFSLRELEKRGHFDENDSTRKALENYKIASDPVEAFLSECCEFNKSLLIDTQQLFDSFKDYAFEAGIKHNIGRNKFYGAMQNRGFERKRPSSSEPFQFYGIGLIKDQSSDIDELLS